MLATGASSRLAIQAGGRPVVMLVTWASSRLAIQAGGRPVVMLVTWASSRLAIQAGGRPVVMLFCFHGFPVCSRMERPAGNLFPAGRARHGFYLSTA